MRSPSRFKGTGYKLIDYFPKWCSLNLISEFDMFVNLRIIFSENYSSGYSSSITGLSESEISSSESVNLTPSETEELRDTFQGFVSGKCVIF